MEARFLLLRGYPDRARSWLQGGGGAERSAGHGDNRRYMRFWVLGNADRASRDMRSSLKRLEAAEPDAAPRRSIARLAASGPVFFIQSFP